MWRTGMAMLMFSVLSAGQAGGGEQSPLRLRGQVTLVSGMPTLVVQTQVAQAMDVTYGGCPVTWIVRNAVGRMVQASTTPPLTFPQICTGEVYERSLSAGVAQELYRGQLFTPQGRVRLQPGRYTLTGQFRLNRLAGTATPQPQLFKFFTTFSVP